MSVVKLCGGRCYRASDEAVPPARPALERGDDGGAEHAEGAVVLELILNGAVRFKHVRVQWRTAPA